MLKCLAIFAMVLAFAQAPVDTPRQGGDKQNQATHNADKGNAGRPSIAQPPGQPRVIAEKYEGKQKGGTAQQKPSYWKEAFGPAYTSNWALVIVGGIAGMLAWLTLRAIGKQADLMGLQADQMKEQTRILGESVAVAQKAADTAQENIDLIINKERAKLRVEVVPLRINAEDTSPSVSFLLRQYGIAEEAFVDFAEVDAKIADTGEPDPEVFPCSMNIPPVLFKGMPLPVYIVTIRGWTDKAYFEYTARRQFIHFYGSIHYKDFIGKPRETSFYYIWAERGGTGSEWRKHPCEGFELET